jgi:putative nucleotidyltransferase with HDIG domain
MRFLSTALNIEESPLAQDQIEAAKQRATQPLTGREWTIEAIVGGAMLAASVALAVAGPQQRGLDAGTAVLLTLALVIASRVRFDVVNSYTVAAQLVFVPMLFLLPPNMVPLLTTLAFTLAWVPDALLGKRHPSRTALAVSDTWFAFGPALVFVIAGAPDASEATVLLLVAALAAQFLFDFGASSLRERIAGSLSIREELRESGWIIALDTLLAPIGFLAALAAERDPWAVALLLPLLGLLQLFAFERRWRVHYILELSRAYRGTAALLGDVVEADHAYTGDHSREVVDLSLAVADELRLSPVARRRVEFGALLHDVGKLAVPKEIIDKAGPLDSDEWQVIRRHTIEGEAMLAKVGGVLGEAGAVVRASHEHWDGGGYPDALRGDAIPIEARIVSCCDAYSAMTTNRSYRRARSHSAALAELHRCAGAQFDPSDVAALELALERARALDGDDYRRKFTRAPVAAQDAEPGQPAGAHS